MVENGIPPTSGLQFLHTASDEILHLLGVDLCALPGVRPFGLRWAWVDGGRFGLLIGGVGVFAPEDSTEERHLRIRDTAIIGFCAAWPAMASSVLGVVSGTYFLASTNKLAARDSKANWTRMWKTDRLID